MQRSSESIGALAAALAKAQAELTNPEKTLTGNLPASNPAGEARSFRYASLAAGLDIVRQGLGRHEIAVMQTTALNEARSFILLTTMLVHASGEWVSSEWPVCPVSELASPQRMGAALTYARRYGLFTLAGIAGEDDTDGPSLVLSASTVSPKPPGMPDGKGNGSRPVTGVGVAGPATVGTGGNGPHQPVSTRLPLLRHAESVLERDRLLEELKTIVEPDRLATWAHSTLPIKNRLLADHARALEGAFADRLTSNAPPIATRSGNAAAVAELPLELEVPCTKLPAACMSASSRRPGRRKPPASPALVKIDKSVLAFPEPRRVRDREHLNFVSRQPCLICARTPSDPHHLRFAQPRALGRKVSDEFTVPVCRAHHREIHRTGDEVGWWAAHKLEPLLVAENLWRSTHPLPAAYEMKADKA